MKFESPYLDENLPAVIPLDYIYVPHLVLLFLSRVYFQDLQNLPSADGCNNKAPSTLDSAKRFFLDKTVPNDQWEYCPRHIRGMPCFL